MILTIRQWAFIIFLSLGVAGCVEHIEEPWVSKDDYLAAKLDRSAELDEALDRRVRNQNDR